MYRTRQERQQRKLLTVGIPKTLGEPFNVSFTFIKGSGYKVHFNVPLVNEKNQEWSQDSIKKHLLQLKLCNEIHISERDFSITVNDPIGSWNAVLPQMVSNIKLLLQTQHIPK